MLDNAYERKSQLPEDEPVVPGAEEAATVPVRPMGDAPRFIAPTHSGVDILKLLKELEDQISCVPRNDLAIRALFVIVLVFRFQTNNILVSQDLSTSS